MPSRRLFLAGVLAGLGAATGGCNSHMAAPPPGTPEHAAYLTSRGYDCGLSVARGRIIASHRGEARARYISAGQGYAVRAYRKPEGCGVFEREQVASALRALARQ